MVWYVYEYAETAILGRMKGMQARKTPTRQSLFSPHASLRSTLYLYTEEANKETVEGQ